MCEYALNYSKPLIVYHCGHYANSCIGSCESANLRQSQCPLRTVMVYKYKVGQKNQTVFQDILQDFGSRFQYIC